MSLKSAVDVADVPGNRTKPNHVLAIVSAGIVLANLDLLIVNVALPDIARDFGGATLDDLSWVLNGYAIVYAALLVFLGRLSEGYRRDRSFLLGIAIFTAASAACSAAGNVWMLVAFRLLQAAGALGVATQPEQALGHATRQVAPRALRPHRRLGRGQ